MRFAYLLPIVILFCGCKGSPLSTRTCPPPEGRFVNATLLAECEGVLAAAHPFFVVELRFRDSVTVLADNGFEQFPLNVTFDRGGCSGVMSNATLYGDMAFSIDEKGRIELMDTAWTKLDKPSVFAQAPAEERKNWGFREHLNFCVFGFAYVRYVDGKPQPGRIEMLPNGQMNGMRPYLGYTLCYAGDCMEEAEPFMPTITFLSDAGEQVTYAMEFAEAGHRIRFRPLAPPTPDIKGSRQVGDVAFEWVAE
jgi:hypothetical protein